MSQPKSRNAENNVFWADHYTSPKSPDLHLMETLDHDSATKLMKSFTKNFNKLFGETNVQNTKRQ